jgi:hypothetical protein
MLPTSVALDPHSFSPDVEEIVAKLKARTVGQDHAVEALGRILETFLAGYHDPERPIRCGVRTRSHRDGQDLVSPSCHAQNTLARARALDGSGSLSGPRGVFGWLSVG